MRSYLRNRSFNMSCIRLLVIVTFLSFGVSVNAANYYVSTSGDDSFPGSITQPWKSIKTSVGKVVAGDTLFVRAGTWVEMVNVTVSGTADHPVVISAYRSEVPVIDGQNTLASNWGSMLKLSGSYIHVYGLEVKNGLGEGVSMIGHHNKISRINTHHHAERGVAAKGDYSIVEYCRVWWNATNNCRLADWPPTKYPNGGWGTGVSAMRDPVNQITDNAILRGNIVYNNWGEGLSSFEAQGTIMEDNIVYDNFATNTYISDVSNVLYHRNMIYTTVNDSFPRKSGLTLADERADKPRSKNNTVINNLFMNADLSAFSWTLVDGSGLDNVLIAYNTVSGGKISVDNDGKVINKSARIVNNIISNSGTVASVGDNTNVTFSNNLWSSSPGAKATGPGDVIGDPLLSKSGPSGAGKLTPAYFVPSAASPAINKGLTITDVTSDFFRNLRETSPDIGAVELNGVPGGIADIKLSPLLKIYPNPAQDSANMNFMIETPGTIQVALYNIAGILVYSDSRFFGAGECDWELPINGLLNNGLYIVQLKIHNRIFTNKLMIL